MITHPLLGAALAAITLAILPATAATMSSSPAAPVIDGEDLANFGTQTATDKWWPENSATGAAKGQTFRTRNEALRFKAVTYRITTSVPGTKVYTIRIGKISGTTFTPVHTESATQTVTWAANDYVTWRLATPLVLQPNTFYGVDVALKSSTTTWQDGIPYVSMTADEFSDGVSYSSGTSGVGNGTITGSDVDRRFHLDIEKPIGGWSLVATDPADNSTNAYASNPLFATFSQNIVRGTGNITLKNLTDGVSTVIPITDPRVVISENLLTVNPGSSYLASKAYAVRIDPTAITDVLGASYPGITNDTAWNFSTGVGDPLYLALVALKNHITGATPLNATQIAAHKTTIDQESTRLADSAALITASFDLVKAYDASSGNRWYVNGLPARASVTDDIHWTLWNVQQYIMDVTYNDTTLANYESVLNGFKFGSASSFPGACNPPANPDTTHTVAIKASYANTLGWTTQGDGGGTFARKPTGCYLAPGSIATVTVPAALVGKGFKIRVGAHSWDFSNKPSIKRLDRSTVPYPINAVETKIACPHGGGIYIEVPWLANQGIVNVSVRNAVRSPYFSAKSFHQTTPTEWLTERTNAAPWADFQSDKFMIQVPRSWIYAMPDPTQMMKDWDAAMDVFNDLLGFPQIRGKESFYLQVDVLTRASVYAPGYPAVNVGGYSATANYNNGYHTHFFIRGPQYGTDDANVEFHEQGHGYFFDKFPGETESNVNLPFVPVLHRKFGTSLDAAFRASLGEGNTYRTLETTAMAWMTVFNFSPREVEMADGEKAYQLKGHAKFVDIARIYGWGVLNNYWKSFVTDSENGVNYGTDTDSLLLRLSKNVGADIRPLFHFWGIYPQNAATLRTAINNAGLVAPVEIYDRLVRYKSLVPANNIAFTDFAYKWWGNKKPSIDGYWEEREHARQWDTTALYPAGDQQRSQATNPGEIYNENSALDITNRVQELINLYYPNGRPTTITAPVIASASPADNSTNVALDANLVVTFNKAIVRGTGNITLTNLTDGTSANIAITDTSQVSIAGEVLTINRTANLLANKTYAIQIDPTAIDGVVSNSFAGITDTTTWNFTTVNPDVTGPTILSLSPADGATNVALTTNLVATFSEPIQIGTGNITLNNLTDATQSTIAVTNTAQVSVSGAVLTINPSADLLAGKSYALQIAATAIDDLAGNSFAGILSDSTWAFTTEAPPPAGMMFADNFDRPNSTDLNASTVGKSGTLGALKWVEKFNSSAGGNASISGNSLFAVGATSGFSMSYVDHNFIDAAISSGGGFSISIDLEHYSTQGTIRLLGIAMGMSKAEAEGWAHNVPTSFTYADLFVGYRGNQNAIQVFDNGTEVINNTTAGDASTLPNKLQIDFTCSDFNTGSTVNYAVTFGGAAMGTGSFTWSGTNENYIGVYSNLYPASGTTGQMDDFAVAAMIAGPSSPYETWAVTNAPGSEPNEDIDGDGVPNAIEFVLGGDKNTKDLGKLPTATTDSGNMTFTFVRDRDSVDPSVSVKIEIGSNLSTWPGVFTVDANTAGSSAGVTVSDNGNGTDTITLTVPQTPDTRKFARLKVAITE